MAKGSGAVGRKGRAKVDGPFIIDEPPPPPGKKKRKKRRGPGTGGIGLAIQGIQKKAQPRPDLEWYDDDNRTVATSDRVYTPSQGANVGTYKKALENIDKVHAVKAKQSPMQIRAQSRPGSGVLGSHARHQFVETSPGPDQGKVRDFSDLILNTGYNKGNEPRKRATLYHEIGHGHDTQQNYEEKIIPKTLLDQGYHRRQYDSENAFRKIEQEGGSLEPKKSDTPVVTWAKAVQRSGSYKALVIKREKAKKGSDPGTVRHLNYLTDPKELYARSYTQYVSKKADPGAMKAIRAEYKKEDSDYKTQVGYDHWRGKDFDDVQSSFDRMFGSKGLDLGNISLDPRVPVGV